MADSNERKTRGRVGNYPGPVVVRPLFRVARFEGGSGAAGAGDDASACFRFNEALDRAGVFIVAPDDTAGDEAVPDVCAGGGIVLCCFCGELAVDDDDVFWGEFICGEGCAADVGFVMEGGALEYNVVVPPLTGAGKGWKGWGMTPP